MAFIVLFEVTAASVNRLSEFKPKVESKPDTKSGNPSNTVDVIEVVLPTASVTEFTTLSLILASKKFSYTQTDKNFETKYAKTPESTNAKRFNRVLATPRFTPNITNKAIISTIKISNPIII